MKTGGVVLCLLLSLIISCDRQDDMPSIKEVKRNHEARLMALEDVVSVGIGRDDQGNAAIVIGLAKPNTATAAQIPDKIDGFAVIVRTTGPVKAQ